MRARKGFVQTKILKMNTRLKNLIRYTLCLLCCAVFNKSFGQDFPFYKEILAFKKQDSTSFPLKQSILFVGSSSFTNWKDVQDYFPEQTIINRGFGGSSFPDVIRYYGEVISPYKAKQVVIYCGENDLAASDTVTAQLVFQRFKQLFTIIRKNDPSVSLAFVSIKPSPSRRHLWPKVIAANQLIKNYLTTKKKTAFIDVYHPMLNNNGTVKSEIFLEDSLHMNARGYAIWKKAIAPYLKK